MRLLLQDCRTSRSVLKTTIVVGLTGFVLLVFAWTVTADSVEDNAPAVKSILAEQDTDAEAEPLPDLACLLCHRDSEQVVEFPSSEQLSVQIDPTILANSVHGDRGEDPLACTDCHQPAQNYRQPHAPVAAANLRDYQIERAAKCQQCHFEVHPTAHPGADSPSFVICTDCHGSHQVVAAETFHSATGMAVCIDCHTASSVQTTEPETLVTLVDEGFFSNEEPDSEYCLACHSRPGQTMTFANGEIKSITINGVDFANSVHGVDNPWQPLECNNCHEGVRFPHEPLRATSLREYSLERYPVCRQCHDHNYDLALDSVHGDAIAAGRVEAAVCTDCHHTHDTPPPAEPRERISHTCEQCHSTIFNEYATSVHGDALLNESNPDVPTCINCHGVHNINDPTTAMARVRSPELCAGCHANVELMEKYNISTDVFATYVADFHGTTVTLFEHQDPTAETNKAVCYDCHGVHNIRPPDDPDAGIKTNLLATCQRCHPDATDDFSDAWTSHFRPSLEHNPLVYLVNLFYQIVIPATVGFFGFLVLTDIYRRIRLRVRRLSQG
jgi:predicted CXXCH cytochrome family protein